MFYSLIVVLIIAVGYFIAKKIFVKSVWNLPNKPIDPEYKQILDKSVIFYHTMNKEDKILFEYKIQEFLLNHRITGIECDVSIEDNLLVAASATIPVFRFKNWKYSNLYEVFLYPDTFNKNHETTGKDRRILGMVGTGYMNGKMILSKRALHHGFKNETDKKNTAIHEFVHLIDKLDGNIDGIPEVLLENQYTIPWIDLIEQKMIEINTNKSDIRAYGGTSKTEFFAVASEYFFERPKLLSKKHPELYKLLEEMFNHDMKTKDLSRKQLRVNRNDFCPCDSGNKFKHCCGKSHFT